MKSLCMNCRHNKTRFRNGGIFCMILRSIVSPIGGYPANITKGAFEMIDIFRLGEFQRFYMEQYPELKIKTCYNPIGLYLNFTIQSQKGTSNGCFPCYETEEAMSKLNMVIIDFLAKVGV